MKRKHFIFFLFIALYFNSLNAQKPLPADEVMRKAYTQAAKENKNVFVITHASWCGWCRKMDTAINDPAVKHFFDRNYVITHLTAYESKGKEALENPGAVAFLTKFCGNDQGLPYWFIFDAKGKLLSDSKMKYAGKDGLSNSGCPANQEEVTNFVQVLKKTSSLNEAELDKIAQRFSKNEQ